jgi:hypothetical protein
MHIARCAASRTRRLGASIAMALACLTAPASVRANDSQCSAVPADKSVSLGAGAASRSQASAVSGPGSSYAQRPCNSFVVDLRIPHDHGAPPNARVTVGGALPDSDLGREPNCKVARVVLDVYARSGGGAWDHIGTQTLAGHWYAKATEEAPLVIHGKGCELQPDRHDFGVLETGGRQVVRVFAKGEVLGLPAQVQVDFKEWVPPR